MSKKLNAKEPASGCTYIFRSNRGDHAAAVGRAACGFGKVAHGCAGGLSARLTSWRWQPMREWAEKMAVTIHALFTQPELVTAARLEATRPYRKALYDDLYLENTTVGCGLWLLVLEHLAVEHAPELSIQ